MQDQDQNRFFGLRPRSCPETDGLRPHHWFHSDDQAYSTAVDVDAVRMNGRSLGVGDVDKLLLLLLLERGGTST